MFDAWTGKKLFPWRRAFLAKFCRVVLPPTDDTSTIHATVNEVERYIAGMHPLLRLGLMGLFDLLNAMPAFRYLRPMSRLSERDAERYVTALEKHKLYELRNAFVAAKAIVMLVYYANPRIEQGTGYVDDCLAEGTPAETRA